MVVTWLCFIHSKITNCWFNMATGIKQEISLYPRITKFIWLNGGRFSGQTLRPSLEEKKFNFSESVFRVKKVGGFLSHEGGRSEKVWHLSQKNVFLRLPLCRVIYLVLWECFLEFVQDDTFPQHEYCIALLRRWVSGIDCRFYTRFDCSWSDIKMMLCGSDVHPTWITSI